MAPYRREWGDSPVLRRYGRVPHRDAHLVAQRIFELAGGEAEIARSVVDERPWRSVDVTVSPALRTLVAAVNATFAIARRSKTDPPPGAF
jgi:hypothetical protein